MVVLNDVTDFRRLEHIRRDFVANVSHELKTPITSIKGFVETLLDGAIIDPVDARRFLQIIAKQADRLDAIIEDLLSLSKIEQGEETGDIELAAGRVKDVIDAAIHICQPKADERKIHICTACEPDVMAKMNAALLEQAVINLLDNAIKYSEPGKEVQVLASQFYDEVTITISDRGCRHHGRTSPPHLRAFLSGRQRAQPQAGGDRVGAGHRQAHRAGPSRPRHGQKYPGGRQRLYDPSAPAQRANQRPGRRRRDPLAPLRPVPGSLPQSPQFPWGWRLGVYPRTDWEKGTVPFCSAACAKLGQSQSVFG